MNNEPEPKIRKQRYDQNFKRSAVEHWLCSGNSARAGYASGSDSAFELNGSGIDGALLDSDTTNGLIYTNFNSTVPGRYVFQFHNGVPLGTP